LLGDAAHIHSPHRRAGYEHRYRRAINLPWKLASVIQERADASLLDSCEPERIAFARRLVQTTDQAFTAVTSTGPIARFLRLDVVPVILPWLFSFGSMVRLLYRTVSQVNVNYRASPSLDHAISVLLPHRMLLGGLAARPENHSRSGLLVFHFDAPRRSV
jgi:hypothetical protein